MSRARPLEIAIVGMGCRFPGAADLCAFWEMVLAGRSQIADVPSDRWPRPTFVDARSMANDRVPIGRGGYLESPIAFPAAEHGVMPRTIEGGEPEQFLLLDAALAALEDSGTAPERLKGRRVDVVVGRGNYFNRGNLARFQHGRGVEQALDVLSRVCPDANENLDREALRAVLKAGLPPFEAATIAGQLTNAAAGRIAHRLDLNGAAFVVDAASASALVALELAARALAERRAEMAIVGAVYIEADVDFPMVFHQLGALSPSGKARPFAADADGLLSGEGVGALILKRLADAERDGDRIYATVRAVGLASDGRSRGLTAPSARGHVRAMRRAYRQSGTDPDTVALVEGHGLGVPAADRAELRALNAVFPAPARGRRSLGAVSALIGHAMPASGMAGLIKTALALYHGVLPPAPIADRPHPLLDPATSPFALEPQTRPWIHPDGGTPRRAAVNAFGFAGANAHAVLEEHSNAPDAPGPSRPVSRTSIASRNATNEPKSNARRARAASGGFRNWPSEAALLFAPDRSGLVERARALADWLARHPGAALKDVAHTLGREAAEAPADASRARLGIVAESIEDLARRLDATAERLKSSGPGVASPGAGDGRGIYHWHQPLLSSSGGAARGLAFLFPGEGSQYPGMLADLCFQFPEARRQFDTADRVALDLGAATLPSEHVFGRSGENANALWSSITAVNVVLNSQWALFRLLGRLNARPSAVAGHSSGEILALAAAEVLRADDDLEHHLGRLGTIFQAFESKSELPEARLVAVATDRERVEALLREPESNDIDIDIAIDNCPHQVVVVGPPKDVERFLPCLRSAGILFEELPFDRPYHTPRFAAVLGPVAEFFENLTFRPPALPVYSCAVRRRMPQDPNAIRALAIDQWTRTVAFRETVEAMHHDGLRVFVDVGARGNLASFAQDTLRGRPAFSIAANLPRRSGLTQLNHLAAALFAQGAPIDVGHLHAHRRPELIDWNAPPRRARATVEIRLGFPALGLPGTREFSISDSRFKIQDSRIQDSRIQGPEIQDSRIQGPEIQDSRIQGPKIQDSRIQDSKIQDSRIQGPSIQDPKIRNQGSKFKVPGSSVSAPGTRGIFGPRNTDATTGAGPWFGRGAIPPTSRAGPVAVPDLGIPGFRAPDGLLWDGRAMPVGTGASGALVNLLENGPSIAKEATIEGEGALLAFQETMRAFLSTQHEVVSTWLKSDRGTGLENTAENAVPHANDLVTPGPWVGEVLGLVPGEMVDLVRWIDQRGDPIAENHTLGGRRVSAVDPALRGLPVLPFAVMAEMAAQAAALVAEPGLVLKGLQDVHAHKWVRYEETPVQLELRGRQVKSAADEHVWVGIYNRGADGRTDAPRPVFEARAVLGEQAAPPAPGTFGPLEEPGASRFTAESLYAEQWLFHGPPFQALAHVGAVSDEGIDGALRVLPWGPLMAPGQTPALHIDAIVLDSFTHLLGCWGLDRLAEGGDVVFPLGMAELQLLGNRPSPGAELSCRIRVRDVQRHRIRVDAEIARPDGTVWMRILDWEDWRFHWPERYRDVFRNPRDVFVGEPLDPGRALGGPGADVIAVWLAPPADMGRPVWRDVLEQIQLAPDERAAHLATVGTERQRAQRLWETIAIKEAARRLWTNAGRPPVYPADLRAVADGPGRARLEPVDASGTDGRAMPSIASAHADGAALAIATLGPGVRLGAGASRILANERGEQGGPSALSTDDRPWIDRLPENHRQEWAARLRSARSAAADLWGPREDQDDTILKVREIEERTGVVVIARGRSDHRPATSSDHGPRLRVATARRNEHAWAWTWARDDCSGGER